MMHHSRRNELAAFKTILSMLRGPQLATTSPVTTNDQLPQKQTSNPTCAPPAKLVLLLKNSNSVTGVSKQSMTVKEVVFTFL